MTFWILCAANEAAWNAYSAERTYTEMQTANTVLIAWRKAVMGENRLPPKTKRE